MGVVAMKVRTATSRELAMRYPNMFYVKVKGGCVYLYEIVGDKVVGIKVQLNEILSKMNAALVKLKEDTQMDVELAKDFLRARALIVADGMKNAAADRSVQATAAGSISGGATGLATGTVVGAAIGLIPAIFTFGLSIPIGAAIGGSTGLVTGTVAGGAVGRTAHKHQEQIGGGVAAVANKASVLRAVMQGKSSECLDQISGNVSQCKTAIVGQRISAAGA